MAQIITITSGKGGVGKTSISLNLSLALARRGYRVCLFDADLGMANVNILTGLVPEFGLETVMDGERGLPDIMIRDFQGVDIIPGSSGVARMADLSGSEAQSLVRAFLALDDYDFFIFDTSAGISAQVMAFCRACREILLVVTPEPTSLTDAYALIKALARFPKLPPIQVVVNQVRTLDQAKKAYGRLKRTVERFLPVTISARGIVPRDPKVAVAVSSKIPFGTLFPNSPASRAVQSLARKLTQAEVPDLPLELFWDQCLSYLLPRPLEKTPKQPAPVDEVAVLNQRLERMEDQMARILETVTRLEEALNAKTAAESNPQPYDSDENVVSLDFEGWMAGK